VPSTEPQPPPEEDRLLDMSDLETLIGIKRSAVKNLVSRPGFPAPVRFSQRLVRWRRSEVWAWIERHRSAYRPLEHPVTSSGNVAWTASK
jgi:predicted DNA-binding transcriptional regulator AlpA